MLFTLFIGVREKRTEHLDDRKKERENGNSSKISGTDEIAKGNRKEKKIQPEAEELKGKRKKEKCVKEK